MTWSVRIRRSALRELERIPPPHRGRLVRAIDRIAEAPFAGARLKGGLNGLRRRRVGRCRVIYEIQDQHLTVLVIRVASRGSAYSRLVGGR